MITFAHENPALHINLSVVNAVKPDGRDALTYEFVVAEEQDFFNQVAFAGNVAEGDQKTVWTPGLNLTHNQTYWFIRVKS